jgi:hypothetical protein
MKAFRVSKAAGNGSLAQELRRYQIGTEPPCTWGSSFDGGGLRTRA